MRRFVQRAVIALFALLLLLPGAAMVTGLLPPAPLDENRTLAEMPGLAALSDPGGYLARLQDWFDDHYGLRTLFIRCKTQLDYSLFGTSDRVHIGSDGFLFYRSVIDQQEPQIERLSDADLDRAAGNFARLRDWLGDRGIRLIVQTQQLKDRFYPEHLPREAWFARRRHRFDDFMARMRTLPGITFLDTTPMLLALKTRRPIFHRTDFHWNDPAAREAAVHLVDTIARLDGRPTPFWRFTLDIVERRFSGGQAMFLPLFHPPSEIALFVTPTWDESVMVRRYDERPFEWVATAREPAAANLPTTVIFGDSFVDGMVRAGLVPHFNRIQFARIYHSSLADVLRALPAGTKFFVVEFIETELPSFLSLDLPQ